MKGLTPELTGEARSTRAFAPPQAVRTKGSCEKIENRLLPTQACAGAPAPPRWNARSEGVFRCGFRTMSGRILTVQFIHSAWGLSGRSAQTLPRQPPEGFAFLPPLGRGNIHRGAACRTAPEPKVLRQLISARYRWRCRKRVGSHRILRWSQAELRLKDLVPSDVSASVR